MKKNKIYFLKELIDFDFLYVSNKNRSCLLQLFEVNVGLKQFCRLVKHASTVESKNFFLYFNDDYTVKLAVCIFNKFLEHKIIIGCTPLELIQKSRTTGLLIKFGGLLLEESSLIKSLTTNNLFLISSFTPQKQKILSGVYCIQNNMDDLKKIIFIFVLILKILKNK